MSNNILVLGAGELGTAILEALANHPQRGDARITVLLRPTTINSTAPEKKKQIEQLQALNIATLPGDVEDPASTLVELFRKYDTVIGCTGMGCSKGTQLKVADCVMEAGVKRFFPWQFGMDFDAVGAGSDQDKFDDQIKVRQKLRAQDKVDWIVVSTGLFMTFFFLPDFGVIDLKNRVTRGLGSWDTKMTTTLPRDIGRVTAELVFNPQGTSNQIVYIAGDTRSYKEISDLVEERFGEGVFKRELWDMETLKKQVAEGQTFAKYKATFAAGKGVAWDKEKTFNVVRGIEMTDLREYLKQWNLE
ncbi:hypothetical protein NW768_002302 [Fusarium equiseti]|uniref:NmrA-like domain-containing protein n=1 Tax=Fusarium equiseti TaxID=61235 RepID=A0ABQ8RNH9_FUSEQ|nr:hypothetical protein NW768_002302 [Fusarium equiseti]